MADFGFDLLRFIFLFHTSLVADTMHEAVGGQGRIIKDGQNRKNREENRQLDLVRLDRGRAKGEGGEEGKRSKVRSEKNWGRLGRGQETMVDKNRLNQARCNQ